jgi:hypothetical protein
VGVAVPFHAALQTAWGFVTRSQEISVHVSQGHGKPCSPTELTQNCSPTAGIQQFRAHFADIEVAQRKLLSIFRVPECFGGHTVSGHGHRVAHNHSAYQERELALAKRVGARLRMLEYCEKGSWTAGLSLRGRS